MLHCRDGNGQVMSGAWFPPDMTLDIQAKEVNLGFIRPENLVSRGLRVFKYLLANSNQAFICLSLSIGFRLATLP